MAKRGRKRHPDEIRRDRARIADLYIQGWTQTAIGDEIGISQSMVSIELSAIRDMWRDAAVTDYSEAVGRELAKLDHLERKAWEAYERSIGEDVTTVRRADQDGATGGQLATVEERIKQSTGIPEYLRIVRECIQDRCKLLGLNAPERLEVSDQRRMDDFRQAIRSMNAQELNDYYRQTTAKN